MPVKNTLRTMLLATLIAVGTSVSGEAATAANPMLNLVQVVLQEGADLISSAARRGFEAMGIVFRAP